MALDKLLENEAQAEISRIREDAQSQAAQIIAQAQEEAQSLLESRQRLLETQRQAGLVRARSAAELEMNASRLGAAETSLRDVYAQVEQRLSDLRHSGEYRRVLEQLMSQAREVITDAESVEVNPADAALVREFVHDIPVRENAGIVGGIRLLARGGKSGITNTLHGRLERVKQELAPQVTRLLSE